MEQLRTLLYYKYTQINDPESFALQHLGFCKNLGLKGRIIVAAEGINGTVSGTIAQTDAYMAEIEGDSRFEGIHWKIDDVSELSFNKMHVRHKEELCNLGFPDVDPNALTGVHLDPVAFAEKMNDPDTIVLDVRNRLEYEMGKFKNAIDLNIKTFREFPDKIAELSEYKDKNILAYCTGGIRCEKATALLIENGFQNVFQLDGGIVTYGKETGGKDFEGKCYVFDKRLAVDVNSVNPEVITECYTCKGESDRMVNCANPTCNIHIVQCESCGTTYNGTCSTECQNSPDLRPYDGTGYYAK